MRLIIGLFVMLGLGVPVWAEDTKGDAKSDAKAERPKTGRPGELSFEEEAKIDKIVQRFIEFDIGQLKGPEGKQALADFQKLGPESIPALIRGLNRSANMGHSCPVAIIAKKLKPLLTSSEDEFVLDYARQEIGAGVRQSPYTGLLNELKVATIIRKRILSDARLMKKERPTTDLPFDPYKPKSPGESNRPKDPKDPKSPGESDRPKDPKEPTKPKEPGTPGSPSSPKPK